MASAIALAVATALATAAPPRMAVIVCRWGGWPEWMPLFMRSLASNPRFHFILLSDVRPGLTLPKNVEFRSMTQKQLLKSMEVAIGAKMFKLKEFSDKVGATLPTIRSPMSAAKVNDLKPLFGEGLADLLRPYEWWGKILDIAARLARPRPIGATPRPPWRGARTPAVHVAQAGFRRTSSSAIYTRASARN